MRIQNKVFLSLLISSIAVVVILVVLIQWSMARGLLEYVNKRELEKLAPIITELGNRYGQDQSWDWLSQKPQLLRQLLRQNLVLSENEHDQQPFCEREECDDRHEKKFDKVQFNFLRHRLDMVIFDLNNDVVVAIRPRAEHRRRIAIKDADNTIGWLSIPQRKEISEGFELVFIEQQHKAYWLISLIVIVLAGLVAFPLARHFVRPIERLTHSTNQLNQGHYQLDLTVDRNDELGVLASGVNQLAVTLEKNEASRKRWLADISHELRTPLTNLKGEIEAMIDGVRPLSKEGIGSMKEEVEHLSKLVNDLYELSNADIGGLRYRKATIDLVGLIEQKLKNYESLFEHYALTVNFQSDGEALVWADSTRINQLLDNLLTNAYRYTDRGGHISISVKQTKQQIALIIEDSAPGLSDEALEKSFDYLYRAEQSRNRALGGSGLGLAICKRIVEAHGGQITACHSSLGGVAMKVELPIKRGMSL